MAEDTRNKPPVFDDQDFVMQTVPRITEATRTVEENTNAGTAVNGGGAVTATDPNAPDSMTEVTYTLGGDDASSFDIGLTNGLIDGRVRD